jgi:hypothetical protein
MTDEASVTADVFISYSHAKSDKKWFKRLLVHLKPLEREQGVKVWHDRKIDPGGRWEDSIAAALKETRVAILLVSADYLASDFIATNELPTLLDAARDDRLKIVSLIVGRCRFSSTELHRFQAANDPRRPMSSLSEDEQEATFDHLTKVVEKHLGLGETVEPIGGAAPADTQKKSRDPAASKAGGHRQQVDGESSAKRRSRSYEAKRPAEFEQLAKGIAFELEADVFTRVDVIKSQSGDDHIMERYEGARARRGVLIDKIAFAVSSQSGHFGRRAYGLSPSGTHRVTWSWKGPPLPDGSREGTVVFDPPLSRAQAVTLRCDGVYHNAFQFNQRDRLEVTGGKSSEESVKLRIRHKLGRLVSLVCFPPENFPAGFGLRVRDRKGRDDLKETDYATKRLTRLDGVLGVTLAIDLPLPEYTYEIWWELPRDEREEFGLAKPDTLFADEISKRLMELRKEREREKSVEEALKRLTSEIAELFREQEPLITWLFSHDGKQKGLKCVATSGAHGPEHPIWLRVIESGRTIIGQAFKRRAEVLATGLTPEEAEFYEPLEGERHTAMFSLPIFYPFGAGKRIAVLTLASQSNLSGLTRLKSDDALLRSLVEYVVKWCSTALMDALELTVPGRLTRPAGPGIIREGA